MCWTIKRGRVRISCFISNQLSINHGVCVCVYIFILKYFCIVKNWTWFTLTTHTYLLGVVLDIETPIWSIIWSQYYWRERYWSVILTCRSVSIILYTSTETYWTINTSVLIEIEAWISAGVEVTMENVVKVQESEFSYNKRSINIIDYVGAAFF